jgi:hypothetical protein
MARLEDVIPKAEGEIIVAKKTFKDYEPGFVHVDIKYLPQMPDESSRRYLFVAIDRATRWVFLHIYGDMTESSSVDFLRRLRETCPFRLPRSSLTTAPNSPTGFSARTRSPAVAMCSIAPVARPKSNIVWPRPVTHKPMAWSNASMAASASCYNKAASTAAPI